MRPSRLIVEEVRSEECLEPLLALNAGFRKLLRRHIRGQP